MKTPIPISAYAGELKPLLPRQALEPARSRVLFLPAHLAVIAAGMLAIAAAWPSPLFYPLFSLIIGVSLAGLVFLGHETLHAAVVREKRARHAVGWVAFLPFVISPRLWVAWHNRVHHGNAQHPRIDPDAYPTLAEYQANFQTRLATDWFAIGRRRLRGLTALFVGFSVQSLHMLLVARRRGYLSARQHRLALLETGLGLGVWLSLFVALGPLHFLFAAVLPVIVANVMVMAHILTNHSLSPLTLVNDPLENSLTVTVPRWFGWLTLGFGFHVEHHLFPWMSSRHAPEVRSLIVARWPERYQSMPLWRALAELYRTPRVYRDETTLIDPHTGECVPTLGERPRTLPPPPPGAPGGTASRDLPRPLQPATV